MLNLFQDVRLGLRMLVRAPAFTAVAVLILALGIGATAIIFTLVNTVILRPLPYEDADRLVLLFGASEKLGMDRMFVSGPDFAEWQQAQTSFDQTAAFKSFSPQVRIGDEQFGVSAARVSASLFPMLKVQPVLGRTFLPEEEQPGKNRVAVVSHRYWTDTLGGDQDAIGATIVLDDESYSVVGVTPPGFDFPHDLDVWIPVNLDANEAYNTRENLYYTVFARLKPSVSRRQAEEEMNLIVARTAPEFPELYDGYRVWLISMLDNIIGGGTKPMLYILLGAVGFVLLIGCASLANLLLSRGATREKEFAIRSAMGAARGRLIGQLLIESLILALLGGSLGLVIAWRGLDLLMTIMPWQIPRTDELQLDHRVLGFTAGVSIITALLFGLLPALQSTRLHLTRSLNEHSSGATEGIRRNRVRAVMVSLQVALAFVLLVGVGLMVRSYMNLKNPRFGFDAKNLLSARLTLPETQFPNETDVVQFYDNLVTRLKQMSQVTAASYSDFMIYSGGSRSPIYIQGKTDTLPPASLWINSETVSTDHFNNLNVPLRHGRSFSTQDTETSLQVAIIDAVLARRFWPNEHPVGQRFKVGRADTETPWLTIVGVVGSIKQDVFADASFGKFYRPFAQRPNRGGVLMIRTAEDPVAFTPILRDFVKEAVGEPISVFTQTVDEALLSQFGVPGFVLKILSLFAGFGLLMASAGLYGVISYSVARRTREIGIRMALGAQAGQIASLILKQNVVLTLCGLAIGAIGAFWLTSLLQGFLVDVTPTDPLTFVCIALLLGGVALFASWWPARRAARVHPAVALRHD